MGESTCLPSHLRTAISVPDVDLRQPRGAERLVQLAAVVDVMGEDALEHGAAEMHPALAECLAPDHLVEHFECPRVQALLDDPEGCVQRLDECLCVQHIVEIVVTRAVVRLRS